MFLSITQSAGLIKQAGTFQERFFTGFRLIFKIEYARARAIALKSPFNSIDRSAPICKLIFCARHNLECWPRETTLNLVIKPTNTCIEIHTALSGCVRRGRRSSSANQRAVKLNYERGDTRHRADFGVVYQPSFGAYNTIAPTADLVRIRATIISFSHSICLL